MDKRRWIVLVSAFLVACLLGGSFAFVSNLMHRKNGELTGAGGSSLADAFQVVSNPREGFPGKDKITILCMGLDDNWTNSDEVYTKNSRTDTLFVLTLDLQNAKATMLSIPRDTYAHIAGTDWNFKINAAYQTGGVGRAVATVNEFLGVNIDHYMVLNIDATKRMVDALGGVDVDVPHEMHYHDKWGHLSIDLMPGPQHLAGEQAVGFARYRHPDAGKRPTVEDGDERRMARQHILLKAMIARSKSFSNVVQAGHLVDVAMSAIRTDLTRSQIFDLAALYHGIQPDDVVTASLPGTDHRGPKGEWFYQVAPDTVRSYVGWLINGDPAAVRQLVTVDVYNSTKVSGLAALAVSEISDAGFTHASALPGRAAKRADSEAAGTVSTINDSGVVDPRGAQEVAQALGLPTVVITHNKVRPNHAGWTPPPAIVVTLGSDFAALASPTINKPATPPVSAGA